MAGQQVQSDEDWVKQYGKGEGGDAQGGMCPTCGQPTQPKASSEPKTFPEARRALPSGNYPRPRLGGMTVAPR